MRWDLYCRVIDNHGDLGVCWRLAADLAAHGESVRLWVDDARALDWMAPRGMPGVQVLPWRELLDGEGPGDVVVEAFGCDPPASMLRAMAAAPKAPCWINLEYLSAEAYVERSHGLPSPQLAGDARGLTKWFFYPGFTQRTGGLLRGGSQDRQRGQVAATDPWRALGLPDDTRTTALLFCYENPRLPDWLAALGGHPARLLVTPGHAARQAVAHLGLPAQPGSTVDFGAACAHALPAVPQEDFDAALRASDFNLVRGEDSLVRALWARQPFVWQLYPQHDGAHTAKLGAFLGWYLADAPPGVADEVTRWHRWWNGTEASPAVPPWSAGHGALPGPAWRTWAAARSDAAWRDVPDLTAGLIGWARSKG